MFNVMPLGRTENVNEEIKVSSGFRTMSGFFFPFGVENDDDFDTTIVWGITLINWDFLFNFSFPYLESPFLLTHAILQTTEVIALQLACFVVLMQNLMRCDTLPSLSRRVNASDENKPFKNLEIRHCKFWSFPATFCYKTEPAIFLVSGAWETCSWRQQRLPHKAKIWLDE